MAHDQRSVLAVWLRVGTACVIVVETSVNTSTFSIPLLYGSRCGVILQDLQEVHVGQDREAATKYWEFTARRPLGILKTLFTLKNHFY